MKVILMVMLVVVLFCVTALFGASNQSIVELNYLVDKGEFNISFLLGVAFMSGFGMCWLVFYSMYVRLKITISRLKQKVKQLQNTIAPTANQVNFK